MVKVKKTRLIPPYLVASSMLVMYLLDQYLPVMQWDNTRLIALLLMVAAFSCILYCAYIFRKNNTEIKPLEKSTFLILSWPYTISRNPIYLCMIVFLVGWIFWLQSISCLFIVVVFAIWVHYRFVLQEEQLLKDTFHDAYVKYMQSTRRWL